MDSALAKGELRRVERINGYNIISEVIGYTRRAVSVLPFIMIYSTRNMITYCCKISRVFSTELATSLGPMAEKPLVSPLPLVGKASSNDTSDLQAFAEFMENGDLPTPAPPSFVSSSLDEPAVQEPARAVLRPTTETPPAPTESESPPPSFLFGLLRRATTTLESTIETARREVVHNEVLASATESITAAFASPTSANTPPPESSGPVTYAQRMASIRTLRVNHATGAEPILMFVGADGDLFVVTEHSIEAFNRSGSKILQSNMNEMGSANTTTTDTSSRRTPTRTNRAHSRPVAGAVRAVDAVYLPAAQEVVVCHDDAALRVYSVMSGRMGALVRASSAFPAPLTCIDHVSGDPARLIVGAQNGIVTLVRADDLSSLAWLHAPQTCETALGVGATAAPVSALAAISGNAHNSAMPNAPSSAFAAVAYVDGTTVANRFDDPSLGAPFAAHAGRVASLVTLFDGAVIVTVGNEDDCSLAVTVAESGRCVVRRTLPYTPTSVSRVNSERSANRQAKWVCPSESNILVGGEEGQIDLFQLVALSAQKLELRLVQRMSDKARGRRRAVLQTMYMQSNATLVALVRNGEVRRWRLSRDEAYALAFPEEDLRVARYDASNVVKALKSGAEDGTGTRLAVGEGVIRAQRVLAMVQEDDAGLDEPGKDRVVEEFQKRQSDMQEKASQVDAELRRAKLRISRRFANAIDETPHASHGTRAIEIAAQRAAALELNGVMVKHAISLKEIRTEAVEQLRVVLINCLHGSRGDPDKVSTIRNAANNLTKIPADHT